MGIVASIVGLSACGGGGYQSPPTAPSGSPPPSTSASVTILGNRGSQSFTPNPGPAPDGKTSFRNSDGVVHRIVANDGSFDSGDLASGQTSAALAVPAAGVNYHCSIHPGMIGAINAAAGPPPPCTGIYCSSAQSALAP
jgi:plastocyanin